MTSVAPATSYGSGPPRCGGRWRSPGWAAPRSMPATGSGGRQRLVVSCSPAGVWWPARWCRAQRLVHGGPAHSETSSQCRSPRLGPPRWTNLGQHADPSLFNPSATEAVVNVSFLTATRRGPAGLPGADGAAPANWSRRTWATTCRTSAPSHVGGLPVGHGVATGSHSGRPGRRPALAPAGGAGPVSTWRFRPDHVPPGVDGRFHAGEPGRHAGRRHRLGRSQPRARWSRGRWSCLRPRVRCSSPRDRRGCPNSAFSSRSPRCPDRGRALGPGAAGASTPRGARRREPVRPAGRWLVPAPGHHRCPPDGQRHGDQSGRGQSRPSTARVTVSVLVRPGRSQPWRSVPVARVLVRRWSAAVDPRGLRRPAGQRGGGQRTNRCPPAWVSFVGVPFVG